MFQRSATINTKRNARAVQHSSETARNRRIEEREFSSLSMLTSGFGCVCVCGTFRAQVRPHSENTQQQESVRSHSKHTLAHNTRLYNIYRNDGGSGMLAGMIFLMGVVGDFVGWRAVGLIVGGVVRSSRVEHVVCFLSALRLMRSSSMLLRCCCVARLLLLLSVFALHCHCCWIE